MDWSALGTFSGGLLNTAANIGSGIVNMKQSQKNFEANQRQQREFAQNAIQWRVADAKKAGLHPLAALGSQGISYSPVYDSGSGDINPDFSSITSGAASLMDREARKQAAEDRKMQTDLTQAQINATNAETAKTLAEVKAMGQSPFHSLTGIGVNGAPGAFNTGMPSQASSLNPGIDIGKSFSELTPMVSPDGTTTLKPNEQLSELLENEGFLSSLAYSLGRLFDEDEKYLNSLNKDKNKEFRTSPSLKYLFSGGVSSRYVNKNEPHTTGEKIMNVLQMMRKGLNLYYGDQSYERRK